MNIFEFLGLEENHRKLTNKVTQLVKHWDEVTEGNKKNKKFLTQVKRDGVCSLTVIHEGSVAIFSRTGKRFTNTEYLVRKIKKLSMPNGVYMGEIWVPKSVCSLEQLSGIVNPNRVKPVPQGDFGIPGQLLMSWFDVVSIQRFKEGDSLVPFYMRHLFLSQDFAQSMEDGKFSGGPVDILRCIEHSTEDEISSYLSSMIEAGEEGVVIRDPQAGWEAGHKGYRAMKMVRGVDYDLTCTGYEEGKGKYKGKVANLLFRWKGGVTIKCMLGKGWTHDMAEEMYDALTCYGSSTEDLLNPIGKIFQVYALEESSKGKLRLAKVGERRFDKEQPDVN